MGKMAVRTRKGKAVRPPLENSEVVRAVEALYAELRQIRPELPPVAVTVYRDDRAPDKLGHFWAEQWVRRRKPQAAAERVHELFISSVHLADSGESILVTLVHESVHAWCRAKGLKDTSRNGKYHNKVFARVAGEFGLVVERMGSRGLAATPGFLPEGKGQYKHLLPAANRLSAKMFQLQPAKLPRQTTRMVKATCQCSPARVIRLARKTAEGGEITCGVCGEAFELEA